jgi:hypothetical protein
MAFLNYPTATWAAQMCDSTLNLIFQHTPDDIPDFVLEAHFTDYVPGPKFMDWVAGEIRKASSLGYRGLQVFIPHPSKVFPDESKKTTLEAQEAVRDTFKPLGFMVTFDGSSRRFTNDITIGWDQIFAQDDQNDDE